MPRLFQYQLDGAEWLSRMTGGLLADEMGVGKTATAISACDRVGANRVLVICPAVARMHWLREFGVFSTSERTFEIVTKTNHKFEERNSVIISYDLAVRVGIPGTFDVVIIDEAHFLKSLDAKRTKAILGKVGVIRRCSRVWALTGTPAPNHAGELWPLMYTFGATALKYDQFVDRYCTTYQSNFGKKVTGINSANLPELKQKLKTVMLRRSKEDVGMQLPSISYGIINVEPGPVNLETDSGFIQYVFPNDRTAVLEKQLAHERWLVENTLELTKTGPTGLKGLEALASGVSALRRYTGMQKIQPIADLVGPELESNAYDKLIIFAIHQAVIEGLRLALRKYNPVTLYGRTDPDKRQRNIDRFQFNPKYRVFIGNIQACGTAINLTAAHNVVFAEQDWVPGFNAQAAMRCHRHGQLKPVTIRIIGLTDSLDQKITDILKRKTKALTKLFDEKDLHQDESVLTLPERENVETESTGCGKGC